MIQLHALASPHFSFPFTAKTIKMKSARQEIIFGHTESGTCYFCVTFAHLCASGEWWPNTRCYKMVAAARDAMIRPSSIACNIGKIYD